MGTQGIIFVFVAICCSIAASHTCPSEMVGPDPNFYSYSIYGDYNLVAMIPLVEYDTTKQKSDVRGNAFFDSCNDTVSISYNEWESNSISITTTSEALGLQNGNADNTVSYTLYSDGSGQGYTYNAQSFFGDTLTFVKQGDGWVVLSFCNHQVGSDPTKLKPQEIVFFLMDESQTSLDTLPGVIDEVIGKGLFPLFYINYFCAGNGQPCAP